MSNHRRRVRVQPQAARQDEPPKQRLLYSRRSALQAFDLKSISTLHELERLGVLIPIKLTGKPTSQVFYAHENLVEAVRQLGGGR